MGAKGSLEWGSGGRESGWNKGDPGTGGNQQSVNRELRKGTGPARPGKRNRADWGGTWELGEEADGS